LSVFGLPMHAKAMRCRNVPDPEGRIAESRRLGGPRNVEESLTSALQTALLKTLLRMPTHAPSRIPAWSDRVEAPLGARSELLPRWFVDLQTYSIHEQDGLLSLTTWSVENTQGRKRQALHPLRTQTSLGRRDVEPHDGEDGYAPPQPGVRQRFPAEWCRQHKPAHQKRIAGLRSVSSAGPPSPEGVEGAVLPAAAWFCKCGEAWVYPDGFG